MRKVKSVFIYTIIPVLIGLIIGLGSYFLFDESQNGIAIILFAIGIAFLVLEIYLLVLSKHPSMSMDKHDFLAYSHICLDELGYHAKIEKFDYEKFVKKSINTVNHTKDLESAIAAIKDYEFVDRNFLAILKKASKNWLFWSELKYSKKNDEVKLVDDDMSIGVYYVSNGWTRKTKDVFLNGFTYGEELIPLEYSDGRFSTDDYFMRHSSLNTDRMIIEDINHCEVANIVIKDGVISIKKNNLEYDIYAYSACAIGLFKKKDIKGDKEPNPEKALAFIEWDILDKDDYHGAARIEIYEDIPARAFNLLVLIAASTFLLFKSMHYTNQFIKGMRIAAITSAARRRTYRPPYKPPMIRR